MTDLTAALSTALASGQTYTSLLYAEVEKANADLPAEKKGRSTIASRKAELSKAVRELDAEILVPLQDSMQNYLDYMSGLALEEPRELTATEAEDLMAEYERFLQISEFMDTRKEFIRTMVMTSIDAAIEAKGKDPSATNGKIDVPGLSKSFRKEGAGYKAPELDFRKLKALLGDDADLVFKTEFVPATTREVVDEEALGKLAFEKPEVMEKVRESLIAGKAKTARFTVRALAPDA